MGKSGAGGGAHGGWSLKGARKRWHAALGGGPPPPVKVAAAPPKEPEAEPPLTVLGNGTPAPPAAVARPRVPPARAERHGRLWLGVGAAALVAALAVGFLSARGDRRKAGWASGGLGDGAGSRAARTKPDMPVPTESLEVAGFLTPEESKKLSEEKTGLQLDLDKLPRPEEPIILLDPKRTVAPMLSQTAAPDMTANPP